MVKSSDVHMTGTSDIRLLGGIGSILVILTVAPSVGWLVGIVGFILMLIAINRISNLTGDRKIFNSFLIAIVLAIAAVIVGGLTVLGAFYSLTGMGQFQGNTFVPNPSITPGDWIGFVLRIIPGLIAIWVLMIISAVYIRGGLSRIGTRLNMHLFETAATVFLIGSILTVFLVGFLLVFVAMIILAVAFFSIPDDVGQRAKGREAEGGK